MLDRVKAWVRRYLPAKEDKAAKVAAARAGFEEARNRTDRLIADSGFEVVAKLNHAGRELKEASDGNGGK